jgi:hypothetical protein
MFAKSVVTFMTPLKMTELNSMTFLKIGFALFVESVKTSLKRFDKLLSE